MLSPIFEKLKPLKVGRSQLSNSNEDSASEQIFHTDIDTAKSGNLQADHE